MIPSFSNTGIGMSSAAAFADRRAAHETNRTKMLTAVAAQLGMSLADVKGALRKGTSLNQLATAKGVSHDDLIATIKEAVSSSAPAGAPALGATQLDQLAESIAAGDRANGLPSPGGAETYAVAAVAGNQALQQVAMTLRMKPDDLVAALTSGVGLEQLANLQGVPLAQVLSTVTKGMLLDIRA